MHDNESVTNKEWADRTVRSPKADVLTSISIFYFQFPFNETERPTDWPTCGKIIIQKCYTEQLQ